MKSATVVVEVRGCRIEGPVHLVDQILLRLREKLPETLKPALDRYNEAVEAEKKAANAAAKALKEAETPPTKEPKKVHEKA